MGDQSFGVSVCGFFAGADSVLYIWGEDKGEESVGTYWVKKYGHGDHGTSMNILSGQIFGLEIIL